MSPYSRLVRVVRLDKFVAKAYLSPIPVSEGTNGCQPQVSA